MIELDTSSLLLDSQRKIIDALRDECVSKDVIISGLLLRIKELEVIKDV
jgi:hypothetical protein